jgi:Xaa-Pro aminopeptidase
VLDDALVRVHSAKRRADLQTWVARFAQLSKLRHRVARGLCRKNILREDEDKVLLIFKRKIYPERDPSIEREIIARLERAIFRGGSEVEPRTLALVALGQATGLLKNAFDKKRLKRAKDNIERLVSDQAIGIASKAAVEAMQAVVIAASIASVSASSAVIT